MDPSITFDLNNIISKTMCRFVMACRLIPVCHHCELLLVVIHCTISCINCQCHACTVYWYTDGFDEYLELQCHDIVAEDKLREKYDIVLVL